MVQVLKDSVRNDIIEAAKAAFLEIGFDASMREIARRANITVGNIYRYYESKEDIILAIIDRPLFLLNEAMAKASSAPVNTDDNVVTISFNEIDYKEALLTIGDAITDIYAEYPDETMILINDPSSNERLCSYLNDLLSALLRNNAKATFSSDDVRDKFAKAASISIFHGIKECLLPGDNERTKELVRTYLTSFLSLLYTEDSKVAFIEFKNVSKVYKTGEVEVKAVDDVSFTLDAGQLVVVLGASGAGKTTLLNLLGGMDSLSSGNIIVDGRDLSKASDKELCTYRRYDIGFIFQFYNLVQNLTAYENVELARQICEDPLDADEVLAMVGLSDRANNFPAQLSGGEQQRVAIARAVAKNPKLLLCDEPTGALDYLTGKQILKVLQDMATVHNITVVMITHNSALANIANTIIRVKSGKITSIEKNDCPMRAEDIEY